MLRAAVPDTPAAWLREGAAIAAKADAAAQTAAGCFRAAPREPEQALEMIPLVKSQRSTPKPMATSAPMPWRVHRRAAGPRHSPGLCTASAQWTGHSIEIGYGRHAADAAFERHESCVRGRSARLDDSGPRYRGSYGNDSCVWNPRMSADSICISISRLPRTDAEAFRHWATECARTRRWWRAECACVSATAPRRSENLE